MESGVEYAICLFVLGFWIIREFVQARLSCKKRSKCCADGENFPSRPLRAVISKKWKRLIGVFSSPLSLPIEHILTSISYLKVEKRPALRSNFRGLHRFRLGRLSSLFRVQMFVYPHPCRDIDTLPAKTRPQTTVQMVIRIRKRKMRKKGLLLLEGALLGVGVRGRV